MCTVFLDKLEGYERAEEHFFLSTITSWTSNKHLLSADSKKVIKERKEKMNQKHNTGL